jgi:hypothetical protein
MSKVPWNFGLSIGSCCRALNACARNLRRFHTARRSSSLSSRRGAPAHHSNGMNVSSHARTTRCASFGIADRLNITKCCGLMRMSQLFGVRATASGRRDSNPRPPGPKPGALTKLRYFPRSNHRYTFSTPVTKAGVGCVGSTSRRRRGLWPTSGSPTRSTTTWSSIELHVCDRAMKRRTQRHRVPAGAFVTCSAISSDLNCCCKVAHQCPLMTGRGPRT